MRKCLLLLGMLSANCFSAFTQTSSQTRTAGRFNDLTESYFNLWYLQGAQYVSADDGIYAYTKKLSPHRGYISLFLQGFGFTIPPDATIVNIIVRARRFKEGKGSIRDYFATLLKKDERYNLYDYEQYGEWWQGNPNYYSDLETEVTYSQSGTGTNSGGVAGQPYQWTPAMINDPDFGVRIQNYEPEHGGYVVVYYDLVQITVEYSQPATTARKSPGISETRPLKEPIVFPNPFITKTNIQFTGAESGKAVVELFNTSGSKITTLFSRDVVQGQVYNISVGDAQLPKGIYVYRISNGKQKQSGRIIKLE